MLELRELYLQENQIKCAEGFSCYPKLEELNLSDNPLSMIFPGAFKSNEFLINLALNNVKFRWPREDLLFLKRIEGSLVSLQMNCAFPKKNLEEISFFSIVQMEVLDEIQLQDNGLIRLKGIADSFPNLQILDVAKNKIFSVDCIEELHTLPEISDVNFKDNPICCHKHLYEMVQDVVPDIEVINNEQIKEAGHRYKEQIIKLRS